MNRLTDHPAYVEASRKLAELQARRRELETQLEQARTTKAYASELEREARRMLGEDVANDDQLLADARQELRVLLHAITMQSQAVDRARADASRKVAEANRPDYIKIIKKTVAAAKALRACQVEEVRFRQALVEADVSFGGIIPPVPMTPCQTETEATERIDAWLAEANETYRIS
jgi:signal transduction histidine kinase